MLAERAVHLGGELCVEHNNVRATLIVFYQHLNYVLRFAEQSADAFRWPQNPLFQQAFENIKKQIVDSPLGHIVAKLW
ncbi:MAG: hypothetical protein AAFY31_00260 [Pseudomonadota bacterium]